MPDHYSLICRAREGDARAFEELMKRHERLVFKIAASFTRERESALDLTQTVFLKAFSGLGSLDRDSHFKAWLTRIASNEGINWRRRERRAAELGPIEDLPEPPCPQPGPLASLGLKDQREQILRGVEQLRPRYQMAISLRYFQGLKVREIAEALECSESMAKHLLFKGVRYLRALLTESAGETRPVEESR